MNDWLINRMAGKNLRGILEVSAESKCVKKLFCLSMIEFCSFKAFVTPLRLSSMFVQKKKNRLKFIFP